MGQVNSGVCAVSVEPVSAVSLRQLHRVQDGVMGVCLALPLDGVDVILGNGLAGSHVWAGCPPLLIVSSSPSITDIDEDAQFFPEVFIACAVTQAIS